MNRLRRIIVALPAVVAAMALLAGPATAGDLDSPSAPGATSSYTLDDVYNRLDAGTAGSQSTFTEPAGGPTAGTMHTVNEIMDKAPEMNDTSGAAAGDVMAGKTFWGLLSGGGWGLQTGSLATQTPDSATVNQAAGYYNAFDLSTVDTDLTAANIKCGVTIFGVAGTHLPGCVAKTGQTACYDASGTEIDCSGTGQDGDYQKGCEPAVAPSTSGLFGGYNRKSFLPCDAGFTDNGDGTVTDNLTGLIWLKNANCTDTVGGVDKSEGNLIWADALTWCNNLADGACGLTDGSAAGDWRLPNLNELRSLVGATNIEPYLPSGHPFINVQGNMYCSSTTKADETGKAWHVDTHFERVSSSDKGLVRYVWPVRGGQ